MIQISISHIDEATKKKYAIGVVITDQQASTSSLGTSLLLEAEFHRAKKELLAYLKERNSQCTVITK